MCNECRWYVASDGNGLRKRGNSSSSCCFFCYFLLILKSKSCPYSLLASMNACGGWQVVITWWKDERLHFSEEPPFPPSHQLLKRPKGELFGQNLRSAQSPPVSFVSLVFVLSKQDKPKIRQIFKIFWQILCQAVFHGFLAEHFHFQSCWWSF